MKFIPYELKNYAMIAERYHVSEFMGKILESFDYQDDELASFFCGETIETEKIESLKAVIATLDKLKAEKRKVFVFGDYDCDGICSTTIMVSILNHLKIEYGYYIPNRLKEGYGLNIERLKQAYEKGYNALITVDNGVSASEALEYAHQVGMSVLVIDHHVIPGKVTCDCLFHPDLLEEKYHYLPATGLTYLIAKHLGWADEMVCCLTGLTIISDVMELKGVNPGLVRQAVQLLNDHRYRNLDLLFGPNDFPVTEETLGFKIIPMINAIGRLPEKANPNQMVKYLNSQDATALASVANSLMNLNNYRKQLTSQQLEALQQDIDWNSDFILEEKDGLHEGLIGIMAGRISSQSQKPAIIFTDSEGYYKGSGRCGSNYDLMELLQPVKDHFVAFGGHKQACGITLQKEEFSFLKAYLKANFIKKEEPAQKYIEVSLKDLSRKNLDDLFSYRPFGQGRRMPLIGVKVSSFDDYRKLKTDHQLKWSVLANNNRLSFISFSENLGYDYYVGHALMFIGTIQENWFRGKKEYQILVEKVDISD